MKQWYEELFENYSNNYEKEPFVVGTKGEVDFIENEINYDKNKSILDIGCGTGRHSIELAKRGYSVTAIDLSEAQINKARLNAKEAGVNVNFIKKDARTLSFSQNFDLVIMICEGGFPLMETDEMNFTILECASKALKISGTFIFTTLNGLFPLFHSVKDFINKNHNSETNKNNTFDLMTFRDHSEYEFEDDDGNKKLIKCNERYYVPSEIIWLLKMLGFTFIEIFGAELGKWNKDKNLTTEDFEMLVIANR
ncbi:MAG: class I SAM-dependent methyltransferase [Candidatus Theseobacter exili]|nr:class I SAM-dependent methyltransferase [Candidatus Theseobacter exili]